MLRHRLLSKHQSVSSVVSSDWRRLKVMRIVLKIGISNIDAVSKHEFKKETQRSIWTVCYTLILCLCHTFRRLPLFVWHHLYCVTQPLEFIHWLTQNLNCKAHLRREPISSSCLMCSKIENSTCVCTTDHLQTALSSIIKNHNRN